MNPWTLASTPISPPAPLELTEPVLRVSDDDLDALTGRAQGLMTPAPLH